MTLSSLIRKRNTGSIATAIPATSATRNGDGGETVARIATVAVANSKDERAVLPARVSPGNTTTASRWWLIHFRDLEPVEMIVSPPATHAEILERHPDAVAAEPFAPIMRQPCAPMTADEEQAIRAWLASIGENDPTTINEVLADCRTNIESRDYFFRRAHDVQVRNPQERNVAESDEPASGRKVGDAHG